MTKIKDHVVEIIVCIISLAVVSLGLYYHEPWFDEAQAYLIARDNSVKELIFDIPHYEGHPPMWHLILKASMLFGFSAEFTLKAVQLITFAAALIMLEFRSPFGKTAKILIPASYFFLYQYAVISRPYALLMFIAMVCAAFYGKRDEKPVRYMISLLMLCLCHSYGIAIAGGLAAADILKRFFAAKKSIPNMLKNGNKRLLISYVALLVCAVLIILEIMPNSNNGGFTKEREYGYIASFFLCWSLVPSDSFITSFDYDNELMSAQKLQLTDIFAVLLISAVIWAVLILICKKRRMLSELLLSYLFLSVIMAVYVAPHHFGIFLIFAVFILWIAYDKEEIKTDGFTRLTERFNISERISKAVLFLAVGGIAAVNIYWDISSYSLDIKETYDAGKDIAGFITENELEDKRIFSVWVKDNVNVLSNGTYSANLYFDKNIFINTDQGLSYLSHRVPDDEETAADIQSWKELDDPDVIFISDFKDSKLKKLGYTTKYKTAASFSWKTSFKSQCHEYYTYLLVRDELCKK